MSSPHDHSLDFSDRGPAFWLPPHGFGNQLPASAWAELADLPEGEVASVLFALTEAGIAAYVAIPHARRPKASRQAGRMPVRYRLWVDTLRYRRAEDLVMEVLATLHHTRPPRPR